MTTREHARRRTASQDLLDRITELKQLDDQRHRLPPWAPELSEIARKVAEKTRELWEVVNMPRVTVGPTSGGGWQVSGQSQTYKTQSEAARAAREALMKSDGGELVIKGRDGKVREQNTIGRKDPRMSKG